MPRIIAGLARGIRLEAPDGTDTRPTADNRKEAIFSSIQFELPGARFLDLFSGCGACGLEALSRGAAEAVLVENAPGAAACIRNNIRKTRLTGARLVASDVLAALELLHREGKEFDIIFLDPPYHRGFEETVVRAAVEKGLVAEEGLIAVESAADTDIPVPEGFELEKSKQYRVTRFTLLRRKRSIE